MFRPQAWGSIDITKILLCLMVISSFILCSAMHNRMYNFEVV